MRAQNYKEINRGYRKFSGYFIATVFLGVFIYFCYIHTSGIEVSRIVEKTEEYDKIYVRQIDLANRIDSLYYYTTLFNNNLNDAQLSHLVSRRKQDIFTIMDNMSGRDVRLYQKLMSEVNVFLGAKDSIRTAKAEEDMLKADLLRCTEENKQTSRQLSIGGITVKK
ncbi:type VI secretion system TssO [Prevotella sp. 10(H)]|uniref:type VI secretion system TssO n=1 Tax=Prevotella sp. 10(H) TaxID=1158294 RepID=UPI0004A6CE01|nr:type VI secretion system TssO [Prevotella sp. 10(H)]